MSTPRKASHVLEAETAVSRVLSAEQAALAAVAQCEALAAEMVRKAGDTAQALRLRTETRIELLSARIKAQAESQLKQIHEEQERLSGDRSIDTATLARLAPAIEHLIDELVGNSAGAGKD
jgi:hypothetical protein